MARLPYMARILAALLLGAASALAQPTPRIGAAELHETLDRLNTLGSVLMMAAHPDDENTERRDFRQPAASHSSPDRAWTK